MAFAERCKRRIQIGEKGIETSKQFVVTHFQLEYDTHLIYTVVECIIISCVKKKINRFVFDKFPKMIFMLWFCSWYFSFMGDF